MHLAITEYFQTKTAGALGALATTAGGALAGHFLGGLGAADESHRVIDTALADAPNHVGTTPVDRGALGQPVFHERMTDPALHAARDLGTTIQSHAPSLAHSNPAAVGGAVMGGVAGLGAHTLMSRRKEEPKIASPITEYFKFAWHWPGPEERDFNRSGARFGRLMGGGSIANAGLIRGADSVTGGGNYGDLTPEQRDRVVRGRDASGFWAGTRASLPAMAGGLAGAGLGAAIGSGGGGQEMSDDAAIGGATGLVAGSIPGYFYAKSIGQRNAQEALGLPKMAALKLPEHFLAIYCQTKTAFDFDSVIQNALLPDPLPPGVAATIPHHIPNVLENVAARDTAMDAIPGRYVMPARQFLSEHGPHIDELAKQLGSSHVIPYDTPDAQVNERVNAEGAARLRLYGAESGAQSLDRLLHHDPVAPHPKLYGPTGSVVQEGSPASPWASPMARVLSR